MTASLSSDLGFGTFPKESRTTSPIGDYGSIWAWTILLLLVNLPLAWGEIRSSLIFLPEAVGRGQWWRAVTHPLVHLSWYHLLLDAGGFLIVYRCLEEKRAGIVALYLAGAGAGSLLCSLVFDPSIYRQGLSGLSGVAHGLMAVTALEMMRHDDQRRWGAISLAAVTLKSIYEFRSGHVFLEFMHMGLCGHPLAASHAGGVAGGILTFGLVAAWRHCRRTARRRGAPPPVPGTRSQLLLHRFTRMLAPILYRVRCDGTARIPDHGPAVLVCNHVSYIDWLIIAAASRRPVHFVMHAGIYRNPLLGWVLRLAGAIPIESGRRNPATLRRAFEEISRVLRAGGLVCIFPEGRLTRTGRIHRFRPGIEKIIRKDPVPVVPLALRGLWGSFFSHKGGAAMRRWPRTLRPCIDLIAGNGIDPGCATAASLQCAVKDLYGDLPS